MHDLSVIKKRNGEYPPDVPEVKPYDITGNLIAYEGGELGEAEVLALFQELVDTGWAWQLQGSYGRTAKALIDAGYVKLPSR